MFDNNILLADLQQQVNDIKKRAQQLLSLSDVQLNTPPEAGRWSVAQVIAHLNFYNDAYLPRIADALQQNGRKKGNSYKPGWLGNYFTKMMAPLAGGQLPAKMKAPSASIPPTQLDAYKELKKFIDGEAQLAALLQQAVPVHLGRVRIATTLSALLRLKLGDTFRFLVAHQQRHFIQVRNVLQQTGASITA